MWCKCGWYWAKGGNGGRMARATVVLAADSGAIRLACCQDSDRGISRITDVESYHIPHMVHRRSFPLSNGLGLAGQALAVIAPVLAPRLRWDSGPFPQYPVFD